MLLFFVLGKTSSPKYPVLKWPIPIVYTSNEYTSNCNFNLNFYNILPVLRKPFTVSRWKWIFRNFIFNIAYNMPLRSLFNDFHLSFLKLILKSTLYGSYQAMLFLLSFLFSNKMTSYSTFLGKPSIPLFKHYQ